MKLQNINDQSELEITDQVKGSVFATVTFVGSSGLKIGEAVEIKPADIGITYQPVL